MKKTIPRLQGASSLRDIVPEEQEIVYSLRSRDASPGPPQVRRRDAEATPRCKQRFWRKWWITEERFRSIVAIQAT
jgi:hypothetical protein